VDDRDSHDPFRDLAASLWYAARTLSRESAVDSIAGALRQAAEGATRAERARCAALARNPYQDAVAAIAGDEPFAVGEKIAVAIESGEPHAP
jgi:hypothetical protein